MIRLSVNVNKVATLRNSRGGVFPRPAQAVEVCLAAGAGGITVHPRADQRHIRPDDVRELAGLLREPRTRGVEYNIEGEPSPEWLGLVHEVRPDQATLVPVRAGEITSEAGWRADTDAAWMRTIIAELHTAGIRVSVFCDATMSAVDWAKRMGADRVELYTEPFAAAHARSVEDGRERFQQHCVVAEHAHTLGLGINAGHDLDLDNLVLYRDLPHLLEVSIGHALIGRAVFEGLGRVVREYLQVLSK